MATVFLGDLPDEAVNLIHYYVDSEMPDVKYERLKNIGYRGKLSHSGCLPEVVLIFLDEDMYNGCKGSHIAVIDSPKLHCYKSMEGLRNYLVSQFGDKESAPVEQVTEPDISDDDLLVSDTQQSDKETELQEEVASLKAQIATKELLITNLQAQLTQAEADNDSDFFIAKIRELESALKTAEDTAKEFENKLTDSELANRKAEGIASELESANAELTAVKSELSSLQFKYKEANQKVSELENSLKDAETEASTASESATEVEKLRSIESQLTNELAELKSLYESIEADKEKLTAEVETLRGTIAELKTKVADRDILEERLKAVETKCSEAENKASALEIEVTGLRETEIKLKNAENSLEEERQEVSRLTNELSALRTSLEGMENQDVASTSLIADLKTQVAEKINEINTLNESLSTLEEENAKNLADVEQLTSANESLTGEVTALNNKVSKLTEELQVAVTERDDFELDASVKTSELESAEEKLKNANKHIDELEQQLADLESNIRTANSTTAEAEKEVAKLKGILESSSKSADATMEEHKVQLEKLQGEIVTLKNRVAEEVNRVKSYKDELETTNTKYAETTEELESTRAELSTAKSKIATLETDVATGLTDADSVRSELERTTEVLNSVQAELESVKGKYTKQKADAKEEAERADNAESEVTRLTREVSTLKDKVTRFESVIKSKDEEIGNLNTEVGTLRSDATANVRKYETLNRDYKNLEKELQEARQTTAVSEEESAEMKSLRSNNEQLKIQLETYKGMMAEKQADFEDSENRVKQLTSELGVAEDKAERGAEAVAENAQLRGTISVLEQSVTDLRSKNAGLREDIISRDEEILRLKQNNTNSEMIKKLQAEKETLKGTVTGLKEQLDTQKTSLGNRADLMEAENKRLRTALTSAEASVSEKDAIITDLTSSVFMSMGTESAPRAGVRLELSVPKVALSNVFVFASGSSESVVDTYKLIHRQVKSKETRSFLVVDFARDTYVDRELGNGKVSAPIAWLQGAEDARKYIVTTRYENVGLLATSLSYINDLFFLTVDWEKRLEELSKLADIVIINVGTLGGIVSDILFNSFTCSMRGHIIVKTSPISLRTAIIRLSGLVGLKNTIVDCIMTSALNEKSEKLLSPIESKWTTHRLNENDILSL